MKIYRNNWKPCKLDVNFNQKQWRQDLASYIVSKLNWFDARVTRAKSINETNVFKDTIKEFEIYTNSGNTFKVRYSDKNNVISSSNDVMLSDYLSNRKFNY